MIRSARITERPIAIESVLKTVATKSAGGTVCFIGTVRDTSRGRRVSKMELETARDLAEKDLDRITQSARTRFNVERIAVVHRVGKLRLGDVIVVIAVSAAHRGDAFKACKYIIDELKKSTPIWKKEFGEGRATWVEG
jgi:molybdopterin synthase catalytic subunit